MCIYKYTLNVIKTFHLESYYSNLSNWWVDLVAHVSLDSGFFMHGYYNFQEVLLKLWDFDE